MKKGFMPVLGIALSILILSGQAVWGNLQKPVPL